MSQHREYEYSDAADLLREIANRREYSPERELLIAVLLQAIEDLKTIRKMSVMHFFCSEHFDKIAKFLDYDACAIRNRLVPTDVQQRLVTMEYEMPAELLQGKRKPGRPQKHFGMTPYQRKKQSEALRKQNVSPVEEASDVELFGIGFEEAADSWPVVAVPEPITYSNTFNSRDRSNEQCHAS